MNEASETGEASEASEASERGALPPLASAITLLLWLAGLTVVTATSGIVQLWYALPFLAPVAVAAGWLVAVGLRALRSGEGLARVSGGAAVLLVLAGLASNARGAGTGEAAEDHALVSEGTRVFLQDFERRIRAAAPGSDVAVEAAFEWARVDEDGALVRKVFPFGPYSLEAYAELVLPERRVFVVTPAEAASRRPEPDEVRVVARARPRILRP